MNSVSVSFNEDPFGDYVVFLVNAETNERIRRVIPDEDNNIAPFNETLTTLEIVIPQGSALDGTFSSLVFDFNDGRVVELERFGPFTLFNDQEDLYDGELNLFNLGANTLTISGFESDDGTGEPFFTETLNFNVVELDNEAPVFVEPTPEEGTPDNGPEDEEEEPILDTTGNVIDEGSDPVQEVGEEAPEVEIEIEQGSGPVEDTVTAGDADGDVITFSLGNGPANGTAVVNEDGSYTYTANDGYVGYDTFSILADDGNGGISAQLVDITINAANTAPDAVNGDAENNLIIGDDTGNVLVGLDGDDTILGREGGDTLYGGNGADRIKGEEGIDVVYGGRSSDYIEGNENADVLYGEQGNDVIRGGDARDQIYGGIGADRLFGGEDADRIFGEAGDDFIRAGANEGRIRDVVFGGNGDDSIYGDEGFDRLRGGAGDDLIEGGAQADELYGELGNDVLRGGDGQDRALGGAGDDVLRGDRGNDRLFGQQGADKILGGQGDDRMFGNGGDDLIRGGQGDDEIYGGGGFDRILGEAGDDLIFGKLNADVFIFRDGHGDDTIGDFNATNDREKIDLRRVTEITDLADLEANHMTQVGDDVRIDTGDGNRITLTDVDIALLDANDFVF